ncbi:hypothetical protein PPL_12307 [Heterostelium album PN500]|uniref:FHF complex subunit HOOK-interacting protein C-terminal domain-containing protein n=1 Tax=Heterostelium pallidum (strain ATCC 26659 / Pp 5 / PN500) TaxID=670386 RepID=D3BM97_HETP5|nr:hypothetical protein PPL_12307 [Heterostelium album PN500]EFA77698.1 hypothetical protein PPL_12307 [Heterostelium album PN500]|eukprot:XP_020429826.1 hypothetical protein PPL_12307 [Heterostelium album PN500]
MQRFLSSIGEVLAPTYHSDLDDLKNHWRSIKTFYIDKNYDIESFHELQLPGHIISMVSLLIEENKSGDAGPCLEFFLKNRILETLCLLGERDTPTGVRKLVLQTTTILLSDLSLPLLPHMSVHKPICRLIRAIITTREQQQHQLFRKQQQQQQNIHLTNELNRLVPGLASLQQQQQQSNDDSEFVNLLEVLTKQLKMYPTLLGFFQDVEYPYGAHFIVYQGLLHHLWTVGSVGERARKALVQCLELMPATSITTELLQANHARDKFKEGLIDSLEQLQQQQQSVNSNGINPKTSHNTSPTLSPISPTPLSPLKQSQDDKIDFIAADPLALLNHINFINIQMTELLKIYKLLPPTIASINYCKSGPPIAPENLSILENYKTRVSFCCSLSTVKHNDIGEYITKLWEDLFITDTLGPALLHTDDVHCATAMLYLREILSLLHGPIAQKIITFLVGDLIKPTDYRKQLLSSSDNNNNNNNSSITDDDIDDNIIRSTLIKRISHPNYIVSLSCLRLFSTLIGLHNFVVIYNLILVNLPPPSPENTRFSYQNFATLQQAQKSITNYLTLFGNRYTNIPSHGTETGLTDIFQNKTSSQTNGYSAYLVDARYQVSLYSSACAQWPPNFLFITKEVYNNTVAITLNSFKPTTPSNNTNQLQKSNSDNVNLSSPPTTTSSSNSISSPLSLSSSSSSPVPAVASTQQQNNDFNNSNNNNNNNSNTQQQQHQIGPFLEEIFKLVRNMVNLPIDLNFIITGILSKLCYYPCPQLYPYLVHCPLSTMSPIISSQQLQQQEDETSSSLSQLSLYSILLNLSEQIEEKSQSFNSFNEILDQFRIFMTDITNINDDNKFPPNSILSTLNQKNIDFLNSVIIIEEFCKELASIIQARVVFSNNY